MRWSRLIVLGFLLGVTGSGLAADSCLNYSASPPNKRFSVTEHRLEKCPVCDGGSWHVDRLEQPANVRVVKP